MYVTPPQALTIPLLCRDTQPNFKLATLGSPALLALSDPRFGGRARLHPLGEFGLVIQGLGRYCPAVMSEWN